MTRKDLERMVQALTDGTLSEMEFAQLQDELRANAGSRAFFRQSMELEMLLVEAMGQHMAMGQARGRTEEFLHRRRRRDLTRAVLATAAALMIAGIVMALVIIRQPETPSLSCIPVPGTQWQVKDQGTDSEMNARKVVQGSTVRVLSGSVKLELESGVVMLMRGPAEAAFPKLNRPVLKHGWLWIDSGKSEDPIEVETPHVRVRDIGTRFGVRVREDGLAEVHLIDGLLEIVSKQQDRKPLTMKSVNQGFLLPASGRPAELPLSPDPFPGLPELLATAANYRTTVLSQGPAGYWRLDDPTGSNLANEVPEGIAGQGLTEVSPGEAGIGRDDGFQGFPAGNRSAYLNGDLRESALINLDVPGGVSREEGAVSFWIRPPPNAGREEVLWLAGESPGKATRNPEESLMHTRLSADGRVEFFIENGKFDVLLSSNFSVADDRWHHIAASWGPAAVELHVDGRRVERADDFGKLQRGTTRGRYVRFGKPSEDLEDQGKNPFIGWVDEIALWNRPLAAAEVRHQFEAARGPAGISNGENPGGSN